MAIDSSGEGLWGTWAQNLFSY